MAFNICWVLHILSLDMTSFFSKRPSTSNLPVFLENLYVTVFLQNCPTKLTVVRPNTESVFGQVRNFEISDSD